MLQDVPIRNRHAVLVACCALGRQAERTLHSDALIESSPMLRSILSHLVSLLAVVSQ